MVTQIAENIYTIPVPLPDNPLKNLNVYVVTGQRNLLVDTGFRQDACREALTEGLCELGVSMENTDIFLTHLHSDHTGLAPELATENTKVFIGERDLDRLPGKHCTLSWTEYDKRYMEEGFPEELLKGLTAKNPARILAPARYDNYIPVSDGQEFRYGGHCFKAVLMPGHTPGHMCLWEEETGICFLGDHVLFDISPNITRWPSMSDSLGSYIKSLKKMRRMSVTMPLPAHRTVRRDLEARCQELIMHHRLRCHEVLQVMKGRSPMTAWNLAAEMSWKIRCNGWEDFPTPQKWFAVGEALAHLDHLIALGMVEKTSIDGINHYRRVA